MNKTITRTATIFMDENDIMHVVIHKGIRMDYEDALDNYIVMKYLSINERVLKLVDSRVKWSIEKKARNFIDSKEIKEKTIARAVIKESAIQSTVLNFFIGLNKPNVPTKIFSDYDEAYNWLLSFRP